MAQYITMIDGLSRLKPEDVKLDRLQSWVCRSAAGAGKM